VHRATGVVTVAPVGLFDKVKKAFDRGGVDIDIVAAPDVFRWADGTLPVTIELTGDDTEERVVASLELSLAEDTLLGDRDDDETPTERARRRRRAERSATTYTHCESFTLEPGEVKRIEIEFPLSLDGAIEQAGGGEDAPEWLSTVSKGMSLLKDVTRDEEWFVLKVRPHVDGFNAAKIASRRIRNLGPGEFGGRNWRITVG
jgi:sporulation-control protein spo0M